MKKNRRKYAEIIEIEGVAYIEDYRVLNGHMPYIEGKLGDLKEWYIKSPGLGDLLGIGKIDMAAYDYAVVKYRGKHGTMYAIGVR